MEGYFPIAPVRVRVALSLDLLHLFQSLYLHAKPSKDGFAIGLGEFHRKLLRIDIPSYKEHFRKCVPFFFRMVAIAEEIRTEAIIAMCGEVTAPLFRTSNLSTRCPADFYREECDHRNSPWIIGIDGNQQHWRFKHASSNSIPDYPSQTFLHIPQNEREVIAKATPVTDVCAHNFKAAGTKPPSMKKCDETGLFAVVCRHDVALQLMDSYAGERFEWVVHLLCEFLKRAEEELGSKNRAILTYDVACRLGPFLKAHHPELFDRVSVAVNKFHGIAHELRCQILYGALWQQNIGETDGEGVERFWSFLQFLVSAGRESSSPNRRLFIEHHCDFQAARKRLRLGITLVQRYIKAANNKETHIRRLSTLVGTEVTVKFPGNEEKTVTIFENLLLSEFLQQREFFSKQKSRKVKSVVQIYEALCDEKKVALAISRANDQLEEGSIDDRTHTRKIAEAGDLQAKRDVTDALMVHYKNTREQWDENGAVWKEAVRIGNPDRVVYDALMLEKKTEEQEASMSVTAFRRKLARLRRMTDTLLAERGSSRADWAEDTVLWERFNSEEKIVKLEALYADILGLAAARAMELRNLKSRVRGNKEAQKVMKAILRRYPAMEKKIKKFNEISQTLPEHFRPPELSKEAFFPREELDPEVAEFPTEDGSEALWSLEMLRSELFDTEIGVPDGTLWPYSAKIRFGIEAMFRRDRAVEEMDLVRTEWNRTVRFTQQRVSIVLDCVESPPPGFDNRDVFLAMLWDELRGLQSLTKGASLVPTDAHFACPEIEDLLKICLARIAQHHEREMDKANEEELERIMNELELNGPDVGGVDDDNLGGGLARVKGTARATTTITMTILTLMIEFWGIP